MRYSSDIFRLSLIKNTECSIASMSIWRLLVVYIYTEAKVDVTQEIKQRVQQAAQAGADHYALCSISCVTSTLASVYRESVFREDLFLYNCLQFTVWGFANAVETFKWLTPEEVDKAKEERDDFDAPR